MKAQDQLPSPKRRQAALLFSFCLLAIGLTLGPQAILSTVAGFNDLPQQATAQQSGVYTDAQARRGEALYAKYCASCHGNQLQGASSSALTGSRFMAKWGNHTV